MHCSIVNLGKRPVNVEIDPAQPRGRLRADSVARGAWRLLISLLAGLTFTLVAPASSTENPIVIGLDANLSNPSINQAGEAIRRGMLIAVDEINAGGGVLGRRIEVVTRNNRGIPARGVDNIRDLAAIDDLVAVFGGMLTPVSLAELPAIHEDKVIYLSPWAAGTHIVDNGFEPNYVFRLSVRDEFAGGFLIDDAIKRGFKRPGLLLWRTGWGRSNNKAISAAAEREGLEIAGVEWFNTGEEDLAPYIDALKAAKADVILLVANAAEGMAAIHAVEAMADSERLPIMSHWGITGGRMSGPEHHVMHNLDLSVLQTFSFFDPPFPDRAQSVRDAYCQRFGPCRTTADIAAPVGVAHAYDLVHILKRAIEKSGSTDRTAVRAALEQLTAYTGLVRRYDPPFTPQRHDALDASDFRMAGFDDKGAIIPRDKKYEAQK